MFSVSSLPDGALRKVKTVIYALLTALISISWILTLAVITKSGVTGSASKFYFFLTWICLPALIYLGVFPLLERTQRFINPYATAALDVSYMIFWLSAICAVQVWTDGGINGPKGCSNFAYGSQSKCSVSYATVYIGIIIFSLWLFASTISVYSVIFFHRNGSIPNQRPSISKPYFNEYSTEPGMPPGSISEKTSSSRSTSASSRLRTRIHREPRIDEEKGIISEQTETADGTHPGRKLSWGQSPPMTAPAYSTFGGTQWRTIRYGPVERRPSEDIAPFQSQDQLPPRMSSRHPSNSPPQMNRRAVPGLYITPPQAPIPSQYPQTSQAAISYVQNPFAQRHVVPLSPSNQQAPYDALREVMRAPLPGPASLHAGGYTSAHHTPIKNSWREDLARERGEQMVQGGIVRFPEADYSRI